MEISHMLAKLPALIFSVGLLVATREASAACTASIEGVGSTPVVQYMPFAGSIATADLTVRLVVDDGGVAGSCVLGLAAFDSSPGSARYMSSGAHQLLYRLFTPTGAELINGAEGIVALPLDSGATHQAVQLRIEVPANQFSPAGDYDGQLTLRLFDLSGAPARIGADTTAQVRTAIEARAEVNIAGGSSPVGSQFAFDRLDFGALSTGATRTAALQVRSTAPVTIRVSSQNSGYLRQPGLGDDAPGLSYRVELDGATLALASGPDAVMRSPALQPNGTSYPIVVSITGQTSRLAAGEYQDLLTIDVDPS